MIRVRSVRHTVVVLASGALTALALAGCSGGSSASSSSEAGSSGAQYAAGSGAPASADSAAKRAASGGDAPSLGSVSPAALQATQSQLARRASIAVQVKDIRQAVASVRATTAAAGGIVLSENIGSSTGDGPLVPGAQVTATTYGEITVSVPQDQLDSVLDQLSGLGVVIRSQISSEDVGAQIVDTQARLKTMQASVDRVRALMTRATDLTQVVALESELSRRQADLEALESQLAALKDSVAMSPVQVSLTTNAAVIATAQDTGFVAGLKRGWDAFTASVLVVLTGVGAVLPFAVAAAVVGLPVWWVLRRRRAARPAAPAAPTTVSAS
jgi:hypothetical protein